MILYNSSRFSTLPGAMVFQPSCLLSFPSSVEVGDLWLNGGCGIGNGSSSIKAGLGEYFERRHFYMEVNADVRGTLSYSLTSEEVEGFVGAFSQTNESGLKKSEIFGHVFNLTRAYRASNFTECHIPTACVSLNYNNIESENFIYPLRDTCGCSFHWRFSDAIFGALKECLERQFLAKFWLTKDCVRIVPIPEAKASLKESGSSALLEALDKSGEVTIIDISDYGFPGVCLLTVYGQKNIGRHVQYCAGMSYAKNQLEAMEKSLYELWQTYRFVDLFHATKGRMEDIEDSYLRYFLSCNSYSVYEEIIDVKKKSECSSVSSDGFDWCGLLGVLKARNIDGFFYVNSTDISGELYFFCKFVSPDMFLHMNNSEGINLVNKYSRSFTGEIIDLRRRVMVPFP
ncbi:MULTISPECIES: YcaO-like family protein [Pseudomonas]|uniref:YcaO-like family protein n=1 Tax=Pseudomonas TaxID=286 RepID=UPI000D010250|nr:MULTISPECIES: YcaO-like family protein [Pseudomonas]PRA53260.1 microcin B17-processing protein McbD [Pseudomonas sp. MYb115]QXN52136.1 YcaO-like family protein [Pseudomonas fluorescens]WSO26464.1 YcaO-like family protein [Pseudomonas fluorescens]